MKLTIDLETRSQCNLRAHGAWCYSRHPSTQVFCLAIKVGGGAPVVWVSDWARELAGFVLDGLPLIETEEVFGLLHEADEIEAHNTSFEFSMYENVLRAQGWPEILEHKWRDSMAKARACALPAGLGKACEVLGIEQQKSKVGHALMMKMCKPRTVLKAERDAGVPKDAILWHEKPEQIRDLCLYCMQDVEAEHCLSSSLPELHPQELKLWHLDQKINRRGLHVDRELCRAIKANVGQTKAALNAELQEVTKGYVKTARQTVKCLEWLEAQGVKLPNLQAGTIEDLLTSGVRLPAKASRFFEIRRALALASVAKFEKFLDLLDDDSRARFLLLFCGADTGRWSGKSEIGTSVQPQNLPKGHLHLSDDEIMWVVGKFKAGEAGLIEMLYGDPNRVAVSCVRPAILAPPGHTFWCADFSAIEGRVLAWLADEQEILRGYAENLCMYCIAAASTLGVSYEELNAAYKAGEALGAYRNKIGKPQELGLGFGGGVGAFLTFGKVVGLKLEDYERLYDLMAPRFNADEIAAARGLAKEFLKKQKKEDPETAKWFTLKAAIGCDLAKRAWRKGRAKTVRLWRDTERCAIEAVLAPGTKHKAGKVTWTFDGVNLYAYLPSGRRLTYNKAHVKVVDTKFGEKDTLFFWACDSKGNWRLHTTFGGRLVENITQAIARDFLREAVLRLDSKGAEIVLHVHDEVLAEVPCHADTAEGFEAFLRLMRIKPPWAQDMPLDAAGWRGPRFKKD